MSEDKKLGRPTKFRREFNEIAKMLCKLGATDVQMAEAFNVTPETIYNWKEQHPTFFKSIKSAKDEADELVEKSLFERARGYSHPDVHISNYRGEITETPITKHYAPDPVSMIFWLKNRQRDRWRDVNRQEILLAKIDVSGSSAQEIEDELKKRAIDLPD